MRSGILESIHAFGVSKVGGPLLALIAVVVIGSAALIVSRLDDLRSARRIESLASRESVFLVNNLLLVSLCAVIFWGTFFPLISEALTGDERSVGPPFFNAITTPLAIVLVLFTGIGPLLAWRRVSAGRAWRLLWPPALVALVVTGLARRVQRRGLRARGAGAVLLRVVRAGRADGRAPARRRGPAGPGRRWLPLGGASRRGPQPPALRRLPRPRRDRGPVHRGRRLVELSDLLGRSPRAGADGDRRRLRGHLHRADGLDRRGRAAAHLRGHPGRRARRRVIRRAQPEAQLLLLAGYRRRSAGFFEGEATSEVGRRGSAGGDFWTAMRPDLTSLDRRIRLADDRIAELLERSVPANAPPVAVAQLKAQLEGAAIRGLQDTYLAGGSPIDLRVNYNPLVIWLWIGGAIGIAGGPDRDLARRRGQAPARGGRPCGPPGPRPRPRLAFTSWRSPSRSRCSSPWPGSSRRRCARPSAESGEDPRVADLEARKEAKYREIRDARARPRAGQAVRRGLGRSRRRAARRGDRDPEAARRGAASPGAGG